LNPGFLIYEAGVLAIQQVSAFPWRRLGSKKLNSFTRHFNGYEIDKDEKRRNIW
jgi:alpha-N-acetylglucosamine transferase